jgi:lysozyme
VRAVPTGPCLSLIHEFEKGPNGSFAATRYQDPAGVPTIGWGHKLSGTFDRLYGATLNAKEADDLALSDLTIAAIGVSNALVSVLSTLTDNQYAALLDFAFNMGVGAFRASTLCHYINTGNMALAPGQFALWVHGRVNGVEVVLPGLVRRRAAEVAVWNAPAQ